MIASIFFMNDCLYISVIRDGTDRTVTQLIRRRLARFVCTF
jgi:hypothetical protein